MHNPKRSYLTIFSQTALHQRVDVAWDKLRQEVDQRSKQFDAVRDLVSSSLLDLGIRHRQQFDARMTNVEESGRSAANIKCSQLCAAERKAYFEEVPDLVQRLIGPARSQMQTSHESFEVENTKVMAREERLKDKVETFNTATQQRVGIECEDRLRQFHMAAEQLSSQLLLPVRLDRQRQRSTVMHGVKDIQNALTAETAAREQGDGFIADSLTRATRSLQQTVLENFGSVDHTDSSDSDGAESGSDSD